MAAYSKFRPRHTKEKQVEQSYLQFHDNGCFIKLILRYILFTVKGACLFGIQEFSVVGCTPVFMRLVVMIQKDQLLIVFVTVETFVP